MYHATVFPFYLPAILLFAGPHQAYVVTGLIEEHLSTVTSLSALFAC